MHTSGTVIELQPFINSGRKERASVTESTPEDRFLNLIRRAHAEGRELICNGGVTGFVPKGSGEVPSRSLNLLDQGVVNTLVEQGRVLRHLKKGYAFVRYELLA